MASDVQKECIASQIQSLPLVIHVLYKLMLFPWSARGYCCQNNVIIQLDLPSKQRRNAQNGYFEGLCQVRLASSHPMLKLAFQA